MSTTCRRLLSLALCCSLLPNLPLVARKQPPPAPPKLPLTAALVLTPDFCATEKKQSKATFAVGKDACTKLEPVLKGVFTRLTRVDDASKAGDAQVVLEPKFTEMCFLMKGGLAFELVVLAEWTARDQSGKAVWIETVQGSAHGHNLNHIRENSVQDMAEQSAAKMSSSPELLKLGSQPVK